MIVPTYETSCKDLEKINDDLIKENQKLKKQQKEFIEYLENEVKGMLSIIDDEMFKIILGDTTKCQQLKIKLKEILSKYKEVVGSAKYEDIK